MTKLLVFDAIVTGQAVALCGENAVISTGRGSNSVSSVEIGSNDVIPAGRMQ